jgi:hypothetical protein
VTRSAGIDVSGVRRFLGRSVRAHGIQPIGVPRWS